MAIQIVDLFCGVGGLSRGLLNVGLDVIAGYDIDPTCQYAYEHNNHVTYNIRNIRDMDGQEIIDCFDQDATKILVGCAPCQPFSQMRFKLGKNNETDEKYNLLLEYGRMIKKVCPTIVSMENVPQIKNTNIYKEFIEILEKNGYEHNEKVIYCADYRVFHF